MEKQELSRRGILLQGGAAWASLGLLHSPLLAQSLPSRPGEETVRWLDQPPENPSGGVVVNLQPWEELIAPMTPTDKFFQVGHYNKPVIDEKDWRLQVTGLVKRTLDLPLAALKSRPAQEVVFTLECSGNHGFPWFTSGIGTATWRGAELAAVLKDAGIKDKGIEVVFYGSDAGEEEVRNIKTTQNFARSMSVVDAMSPHNILCYEMNGAALPPGHGFPLRLIAPGWYGIANVKWLKRIEVLDTRYMGRFMGRDYVTLREEQRGSEKIWTETSVGRTLLKSVPGKVTRLDGQYRVVGAAWGAPIERVEVQIDGGPWMRSTIERSRLPEFAWRIWTFDWQNAAPGEHVITSSRRPARQRAAVDGGRPHRRQTLLLGEQRAGITARSSGVVPIFCIQRSADPAMRRALAALRAKRSKNQRIQLVDSKIVPLIALSNARSRLLSPTTAFRQRIRAILRRLWVSKAEVAIVRTCSMWNAANH